MLQNVARAIDSGYKRVVLEAVPGAGKSHLLRSLSRGHKTLILAYNAFLASETIRILDEERDVSTVCVTFHALCGRYIDIARDDFQLEQLVSDVENGTRTISSYPSFERVLIDEAQDVRPLYIRLLRVLNLLTPDVILVVVGDRLQLVYDFDEDFPASLDVLTNPPRAILPGAWTRIVTNETRRLTRPMCAMINGMFGSNIYTDLEGPKVEVRCPKSAFGMYDILSDIVDPFLLLMDRRRNNAPLRELLNRFSRSGVDVHVHGVDTGESASDEHVRCATFWSAKGIQASTVVVLLPGSAARNPTYVALTRSCKRLVVVLDPKEPHAAFCDCVVSHPSHFQLVGPETQRVVQRGRHGDITASMEQRPRVQRSVVALDNTEPRTSAVKAACSITENGETNFEVPETEEETTNTLVISQMARTWAECDLTRRCRAMEGILHPTRMDPSVRDAAISNGFVGRSISPFQVEILSKDLFAMASTAYSTLMSAPDAWWIPLFRVSAAVLTWDTFEYIMRRHVVPSHEQHMSRVEWTRDLLRRDEGGELTFDTRLVQKIEGRTFHARAHASSSACAYHVEWDASSTEIGLASVRALLHPSHVCRLLILSSMKVITVTVHDAPALWETILSDRG